MSIAENGNRLGRPPSFGKSDTSVMDSVARNPSFVRDTGLTIEGVNQALSIYKRELFCAGVCPIDIMKGVNKIIEDVTRRRAVGFIQTIAKLSSDKKNSRNGSNNGNLNGTSAD